MEDMDNISNTPVFGFSKSGTGIAKKTSFHGSLLSSFTGSLSLSEGDTALPRDVSIALTYGLELIKNGAMLVSLDGRLQLANRTARAILQKNDGLLLAQSGLRAERAADTRLLQKLLEEAIHAPELGEPCGSPLTLPRKAAQSALIVRVVPGPRLECWPGTENRAALLMLYDQDTAPEVDDAILSKLYGLTRGESALATHLLRGKSVEEAAAELFISLHTARTHLKRIFMKTATHRQTEFVVRMFSSVV